MNDLLHPKGKKDMWVMNKFNTWRIGMDFDQSIYIEALSFQNLQKCYLVFSICFVKAMMIVVQMAT